MRQAWIYSSFENMYWYWWYQFPPKMWLFETCVSARCTLQHQNDFLCKVTRLLTLLFPSVVFPFWLKSCLWKLLSGLYTGKISRSIYPPQCDTPSQVEKEGRCVISQRSRCKPAIINWGEVHNTSSQYSVFTSLMCLTSEKFKLVTEVPFHEMNNVTWQRSEVF
jgi:hypothetical protein